MGKLSELFCAVLCTTVVHSDTHTHIRAVDCVFFCCSLDYFDLVLFAFVELDLVSSVLCLQCFDAVGWAYGL